MTLSILEDAFAHHMWATLRLIDACADLKEEQLQAIVPGTYGSIIETVRHLVGADAAYLFTLTGGERPEIDEAPMDLAQLRAEMAENGPAWSALLARGVDAGTGVVRHRDAARTVTPR